jgi:histidine triad (HIT) family protein
MCVFCKIIAKEIPSDFLHEDDATIVIRDKSPICKVHVLVIAKKHVESIFHAVPDPNTNINMQIAEASVAVARCMETAIAYSKKHLPNGVRLVINTGEDGGQTVKHFHIHLLGGEKLPVGGL